MKLFYKSGACSLSPHIVLEESGLDYALEEVDLKAKTLKDGGDYRAVNPKGSVPALQIDEGGVLTEGPAIVQYIADRAGKTDLAPAAGSLERYRLQEWLNFVSSELHKTFAPLFRPDTPADYQAVARKTLAMKFAVVNEALATNAFLMGKTFTAADAYLYTVTRWAWPMSLDLSAFSNLLAFMKRVEARPHVKTVLDAEGLKPVA